MEKTTGDNYPLDKELVEKMQANLKKVMWDDPNSQYLAPDSLKKNEQTSDQFVSFEQMYPETAEAYKDAKNYADKAMDEAISGTLGTIRDAESVLDKVNRPSDYAADFASRQAQKMLGQIKKDDPNFDYSFKHKKGEVRSGPNNSPSSGKHL